MHSENFMLNGGIKWLWGFPLATAWLPDIMACGWLWVARVYPIGVWYKVDLSHTPKKGQLYVT